MKQTKQKAPKAPKARRYGSRVKYVSNYMRSHSTGKEYYQNKKGRCEDAPCCGCCNC